MSIEVEKLALINEQVYGSIGEKLISLGAEDLGENNTKSVFFHPEDARVKVQTNESKGTAKVVWKSGGSLVSHDGRTEIELPFDPKDFDIAVDLVSSFLPGVERFSLREQKRHDYVLDGINVSVKYSDDFQYHVELDTNVDTDDEVEPALAKIEMVAEKMGIEIMSADQENNFMRQMRTKAPK